MSKGSGGKGKGTVAGKKAGPVASGVAGGDRYGEAASRAADYFRADAGRLQRVKAYTGAGYSKLNEFIRNGFDASARRHGKSDAKRELEKARALQRDLKAAPTFAATVYRGMTLKPAEIAKMRATKQFVALNFFSTSVDSSRAFGGNVKMTITQRRGVPIERVSLVGSEKEVLIPGGTRFRVTSIVERSGTFHVKMEEI